MRNRFATPFYHKLDQQQSFKEQRISDYPNNTFTISHQDSFFPSGIRVTKLGVVLKLIHISQLVRWLEDK